MTKYHGLPTGVGALAALMLILAAAQPLSASRIFATDYFFDDFPVDGSAPDAAKWSEVDTSPSKLNVSGGFLTTQRTAAEVYEETLTSALVYPPNVPTWIYETRFRVFNDGQDISNAPLIGGARPGFGGRDLSIFLANGNGADPSLFGIGVNGAATIVPSRDFVRGQFYTLTVVHNAAGAAGYSDDTLDVFVDGVLYSSYNAFPDGGGLYGPPPVVRVGSGGYQGEIDYVAVGVPEPTCAALVLLPVMAAVRRRRAR